VKLRKVISGGQTGADKTGLECAKKLGLETGGTAPKGYRTEAGKDLTLRDTYGLSESPHWDYAPRTKQNVLDAEITVWFGNLGSPGYWCTKNAARGKKEFIENPTPEAFKILCNHYEVINIAGNRSSKNPRVIFLVQEAFAALKD
jgi:hypothetical protein